VREATPADLFADFSGQILCCTHALAAWAALGAVLPARAVIAGYSVDELAAGDAPAPLTGPALCAWRNAGRR
jgi:[acyl-carrier-protein] S-malonyltransferase